MKEEKKGSIVRKPKSVKNYINGPDFFRSLVEYNELLNRSHNQEKKPQIPKYIGECIMKIAEKLSTKYNFINYSFKDEMVLDAIEKMVEKVEKYDITRDNPNPFAYFSQIAWNVFLQKIKSESRETYTKHKNFERQFASELVNMDEGIFNNEEHNKVIEKFEAEKVKNNYASHSNLDYTKNKRKKKHEE